MHQRERVLVGAMAGVVVLFVGQMFCRSYSSGLSKLDKQLTDARKELADVDLQLKQARLAESKLAVWRTQSLPNDPKDPNGISNHSPARPYQVYSDWLSNTLEKAKLRPNKTRPLSTTGLSSTIGTVAVQEEMTGSLTNLIDFLYEFYSTPLLHQITRLELRPDSIERDSNNLKMMLQVEAIILPESTNTKVRPDGKLDRFKLPHVSDYQAVINDRDIFRPYKALEPPPPPPPPPPRTRGDERFAKFTGTHLGSKGLIAWIYCMNTGRTLLVSEGDLLNVGEWWAKVVSVEPRAMTFESEGKRIRVEIGTLVEDGKTVAMP